MLELGKDDPAEEISITQNKFGGSVLCPSREFDEIQCIEPKEFCFDNETKSNLRRKPN